jgi:hypothetical protein
MATERKTGGRREGLRNVQVRNEPPRAAIAKEIDGIRSMGDLKVRG